VDLVACEVCGAERAREQRPEHTMSKWDELVRLIFWVSSSQIYKGSSRPIRSIEHANGISVHTIFSMGHFSRPCADVML
jgi:hypothetical protein